MNFRTIITGTAAVLFVGASVGAFQEDGVEVDLQAILPVSAMEQTAEDRTLATLDVDLAEHGIVVDNLRSVGSDGIADYWVSVVDDSQVCLVGYISGDNWVVASTCSTVSEFYRQGVGLELGQGENSGTEAYLLPADIDAEQLGLPAEASTFGTVKTEGAVLISVDPEGPRPAPTEVERENGIVFQFLPLMHPER